MLRVRYRIIGDGHVGGFMSRAQTLQIPLQFTGHRYADISIDDNDPLALLIALEDRDDAFDWSTLSGFPSRCAMLSAWTGRIYGRREDE